MCNNLVRLLACLSLIVEAQNVPRWMAFRRASCRTQTMANLRYFVLIRLLACLSLSSMALVPAAGQDKNKPGKDNLETQYGDIHITQARHIIGKGDFSGVRLTGPKTLVTVPYPRSHSVLVIHADEIATQAEHGDQFAHATLTGNVRYTMTQTVGKGDIRTVTGTAEKAVFNHKTQRIEMENSVHITLNDPDRLAAPGTVSAGRVVVEMDKTPYLYTLSGSPGGNDIVFTPKEDAPKLGDKPKKNGVGSIHAHDYDSGIFQIGQSAHFEGDSTVVEISGRDNQSQADIRASAFDADFMEKGSALKHAVAQGNVRYRITSPKPKSRTPLTDPAGEIAQTDSVTGRSDSAEYDAAAAKFTLAGHVDADILAPGALQNPAKIKVERLIAHSAAPFSYELKCPLRNGLITFAPMPPLPPPVKADKPNAEPPKPRFLLGNVKISRFDYALYEPGRGINLTTQTGKVAFETEDAATQTSSTILARDVTAKFNKDNIIETAQATGLVEFRVRQVTPKTNIAQVIEGNAPEIVFAAANETRRLTMPGPFRAAVSDPAHLVQPGNLTGLKGDKLILNLTGASYEYDLESDNETAQIDLIPIGREKKPDVKPAGKNSASTGKSNRTK